MQMCAYMQDLRILPYLTFPDVVPLRVLETGLQVIDTVVERQVSPILDAILDLVK